MYLKLILIMVYFELLFGDFPCIVLILYIVQRRLKMLTLFAWSRALLKETVHTLRCLWIVTSTKSGCRS